MWEWTGTAATCTLREDRLCQGLGKGAKCYTTGRKTSFKFHVEQADDQTVLRQTEDGYRQVNAGNRETKDQRSRCVRSGAQVRRRREGGRPELTDSRGKLLTNEAESNELHGLPLR